MDGWIVVNGCCVTPPLIEAVEPVMLFAPVELIALAVAPIASALNGAPVPLCGVRTPPLMMSLLPDETETVPLVFTPKVTFGK